MRGAWLVRGVGGVGYQGRMCRGLGVFGEYTSVVWIWVSRLIAFGTS